MSNIKIKSVLDKSDSKYRSDDKKNIVFRIEKLNNDDVYTDIFNLIKNNDIKYSVNNNGVYLNFNLVKDDIIVKIEKILTKYEKEKRKIIGAHSVDSVVDRLKLHNDAPNAKDDILNANDIKLSNYEKSVVRRNRTKKN